jgi:hypothetical protein
MSLKCLYLIFTIKLGVLASLMNFHACILIKIQKVIHCCVCTYMSYSTGIYKHWWGTTRKVEIIRKWLLNNISKRQVNPKMVIFQNLVHKRPSCHQILFQIDEHVMVTV